MFYNKSTNYLANHQNLPQSVRCIKGSFVPVLCFTLAACASAPSYEKPAVSQQLEPVERPEWVVGTRMQQRDNMTGEEKGWTIIDVTEEGNVSAKNEDGCIWTTEPEWFSPVVAWENCGSDPKWNSGSRKIVTKKGELWPLKVGNKAKYKHTYQSTTGEKGANSDSCEVKGIVRVAVELGEMDVYKINCRRSWDSSYEDRTWYWSPEHGEVKYTRIHSKKGVITHNDQIQFNIPG